MKSLTFILVVFLFSSHMGNAQQLFMSSYFEATKVSPKLGTEMGARLSYDIDYAGYNNRMWIEMGGFYQKEANVLFENNETVSLRFYEKEFYGLFFAAPVTSFNNGSLMLKVRTGVINGENFAITPSAIANYRLSRHLEINIGVGVRSFNPTVQSGIRFNL